MSVLSKLEWCPGERVRTVFRGRIRDGQFGRLTSEAYSVLELERVRLGYLDPFPSVDYASPAYRLNVNGSAEVDAYLQMHAPQQAAVLDLFRQYLQPDAPVADCGCGGGALLDLIRQITGAPTYAIEPFSGYHESLAGRGHSVFSSVAEAVASGVRAEFAVSCHVIEHVENPVQYLADIVQLIEPGGAAVVLTPNLDDILMKLDPLHVNPFFYRRVHNYYFTAESLRWVAELAGWSVAGEIFYHEFGLANTLLWLRDHRPTGNTPLEGIDGSADRFWKDYLERSRQANNVGVLLRRCR